MGDVIYRNWYIYMNINMYMRVMGNDMDHKRDDGGERRLPEDALDYCFPGHEMN